MLPFSPKSSAPIIIEGSGWGQRRQRALAVHMWQEAWTRGISPLPSQHRFICNRKSAAMTVFQECLKMATGQIPIKDISIILWNTKTFIQFILSNPKFYTTSLYLKKTSTELKRKTKTRRNVSISFPTTESNSIMFTQMKLVKHTFFKFH